MRKKSQAFHTFHKLAKTAVGGVENLKEKDRDKEIQDPKSQIYLGILIDRKNSTWQIGKRSRFLYREMTEAAKINQMVLYFFFARDVDWEKRQVYGHIWEREQWAKSLFPLPTVIYSRIVERSWENRTVNQEFLAKVKQDPQTTLFNSRFLNKYEVAQALGVYPELRPYLPQTDAGSQENLKNILNQHPDVYIKPIDGCKGQGIIFIQRKHPHTWMLKKANSVSMRSVQNFEQLVQILDKWRVPLEKCILQQAISRALYRGRNFDIRALAQKNGEGEWTYVGAAARLAAPGREVTHMVNGGKRISLIQIFEKNSHLNKKKKQIQSELRWLCQVVPKLLEKQIPLNWGLFAFDIALTPDGKLYLLEVNSRPGSYSERKIRRRSLAYLMAYCRYLAERGSES